MAQEARREAALSGSRPFSSGGGTDDVYITGVSHTLLPLANHPLMLQRNQQGCSEESLMRDLLFKPLAFTVLSAVLVFAACDNVHSPAESGSLHTLSVEPDSATMPINGSADFTAVGRDADGVELEITPTWSIVEGGGSIDSEGLFTASTTPGTFSQTVQASANGRTATASVTVTTGQLAEIVVNPDPDTMPPNGQQQFTATGFDEGGNEVEITPTWSVVNSGGTIDNDGMFTADTAAGTYDNTVQAASEGIAGNATVTVESGPAASMEVSPNPVVLPIEGRRQFTAVGFDEFGNEVEISPTWSVVNGGGSVNSTGFFTAGTTSGTFNNTVEASSGGISDSATVEVTAGALASITVTPDPKSLGSGDTQQYTAVGEDANGNTVVITPIWSVVNGGGSINSSGLFTAGTTSGTFDNTVQATSDGISDQATVTVTAPPVTPPFVDLGTAETHGIIAATEVTCISGGEIHADVSIHPGTALTGFGPCVILGDTNLGNAVADQAQLDLTSAYNELAGLACDTNIVADLGGTTVTPGVYCSGSGIGVTGTLTLDAQGDPDAVFVFQAGSTLTTAGDVVLINGAQAKNVYWQVGSSATLGTASLWKGNILALESITLNDNAVLTGRALARNGAVTLGTNNVIVLP